MKKRLYILVGVAVAVCTTLAILLTVNGGWRGTNTNKVRVSATFYPIAEFARAVGGTRVQVDTLVKPGLEPHDYDPSPQDLAKLYRSNVFAYNGAGLETWAAKIRPDLLRSGVAVADTSANITLRHVGSGSKAPADPHIWLDPVLARQQVFAIRDALVRADPAGAAVYSANAQTYAQHLTELDTTFRQGLEHCQQRRIVTSHQAFSYVAARYNLTVTSISGLSPDDEPSPQTLAQTAQFVREHHISHIFFESLVSPKLAQTIARETGAQTLTLNPIEGLTEHEQQQGKSYLTIQRENLHALRTALHCQ